MLPVNTHADVIGDAGLANVVIMMQFNGVEVGLYKDSSALLVISASVSANPTFLVLQLTIERIGKTRHERASDCGLTQAGDVWAFG